MLRKTLPVDAILPYGQQDGLEVEVQPGFSYDQLSDVRYRLA
jgi:hypothetical protein